jgi:CheY-like chemotaxis protein
MSYNRPIFIIDDDVDDHYFLRRILRKIDPDLEVMFFLDGKEAFNYLMTTTKDPFLILCDINMPVMTGLEFKELIDKNDHLRNKNIPFIFLSTTARKADVEKAYRLQVQGFFEKQNEIEELEKILKTILNYWEKCKYPNCLMKQ